MSVLDTPRQSDCSLSSLGPLRHAGPSERHQQAADGSHVGPHPAHQHCLPVLLHPAAVGHAHPPGLPQHVLHRHLLPQSRRGGHQRRSIQPLRQHKDRGGVLSRTRPQGRTDNDSECRSRKRVACVTCFAFSTSLPVNKIREQK